MRRALLAVVTICSAAIGQQASAPSAFEVATVKPAAPGQLDFNIEPGLDTLTMRNVTLRQTIQFAYHLHEYQISGGPKWVDSDGYDIVGKTGDSLRAGLRGANRPAARHAADAARRALPAFRAPRVEGCPSLFTFDRESGFRLAKISPGGPKRTYGRPDKLVATGATLAEFVSLLEAKLQLPVVDHTGIEGLYNFSVEFAPADAPDSPYPSIFTALQEQCGLKLEKTATPAESFAIERVEKPSEN